MPFDIRFRPAAEQTLQSLPPRRARYVRESLQQRLEKAAQVAAMRRFDEGAVSEAYPLRVGDFELRYSVDRAAAVLHVHELVRLPSSRLPAVG